MNKKRNFFLIIFIVALGVALFQTNRTLRLKSENEALKKQLKRPSEVIKKEEDALIAKVKKLIELPPERPSIATVADKTKLKNQPFFKNAENGDKLLMFVKARKVILYRESANRIVDVGVLNVNNPQGQVAGEEKEAESPVEPTSPPAKPTATQGPEPTETP